MLRFACVTVEQAMSTGIFSHLLRTLEQTPHRDVTLVPYATWFAMYVDALQTYRRQLASQSSTTTTIMTAAQVQARLFEEKRQLNGALLSRIFAPQSNSFRVPSSAAPAATSRAPHAAKDGPATAWQIAPHRLFRSELCSWTHAAADAAKERGVDCLSVRVCDRCEWMAPCFLTDSIRGGRCVETCSAALRQQSALHTTARDPVTGQRQGNHDKHADDVNNNNSSSNGNNVNSSAGVMHIVFPFTTLAKIKQQAHLRCEGQQAGAVLSLQERRARQMLLQSMAHLIHLQRSVIEEEEKGGALSQSRTRGEVPALQVSLLPPTDEWDALCGLPAFRAAWRRSAAAMSLASTPDAGFSLQAVCSEEDWLTRLVYLTVYGATCLRADGRTRADSMSCEENRGGGGVAANEPSMRLVLSSDSVHALRSREARREGAGAGVVVGWRCATEQSEILTILSEMNASRRAVSAAAGLAEDAMSHLSTHAQAVRRCGAMVRRMTTREENMRFVLQQK